MKRRWVYLGALYSLVTQSSNDANAHGRGGPAREDNPWGEKKNKSPEDDNDAAEDTGSENNQGSAQPKPHAASDGDGQASGSGGSGGGHASGGDIVTAIPHTGPFDGSGMYAPTAAAYGGSGGGSHGGPGYGGGGLGGRGGSTSGRQSPDETEGDGANGTSPGTSDDDDTSPAESGMADSDPADADAMTILLGGFATASGAGASTSGDVNIDIVDYGPVTIGYGYATYTSMGGDSADAMTFVDVAGADLVYTFDYNFGHDFGFGQSYEQSTTYVLAIDLEEDEFPVGFFDNHQGPGGEYKPFWDWLSKHEEEDVQIDGNFAEVELVGQVVGDGGEPPVVAASSVLSIDEVGSFLSAEAASEQGELSLSANAIGIDTLAIGEGSILEVEDQFSSISGVVIAGA